MYLFCTYLQVLTHFSHATIDVQYMFGDGVIGKPKQEAGGS